MPTKKKPALPAPVTGRVALVGAGPGDPGLLTLRGAQLLAEADVVVVDRLVGEDVLRHCRAGVEIVRAGKVPHGEGMKQEDINAVLIDRATAGSRVVRLKGGDPFVFGRGGEEAEACVAAGVPWEVVPGVTSAIAVPAYAGIPVTHRGVTQDVAVVSAHLDPGTDESTVDWAALASGPGTLVLLMAVATVGKVAARLVEHGRPGDTPVAMTRWGTTAEQKTVVSTLDRIEADATEAGMTNPAVIVVGDVVRLRERLSWFESRPLFGWRVLVPRTKEQAGETSALLRALGATPVEVPTIAVEPPRSPAPMDRALKGMVTGRYSWVVFTSANAVKAVREKLEEVGLDARAFAGLKVAAIGDVTESALLAYGIKPELVPSGEQSSEGLVAEFPPHDDVFDPIDRVLLPRADIATETLAAGLQGLGWQVDDVTAYRTVRAAPPPAATREALKGGGFDAVVFTSSSTVRNLVGIAGKPHDATVLAAIGPKTAETVLELGLRVDVQPEQANVASLVQALGAFALQRRLEQQAVPAPAPKKRIRR